MCAYMVVQLDRCSTTRHDKFSFGSIMCAFMFKRVVLLRSQVILNPPTMKDPRLVIWGKLLPRQGGGEVGNYFTPLFEGV